MTKLLRLPDVIERTSLSRSAIYDRIAAGNFPKPIKLGHRSICFAETEIGDWINKQLADREAA